MGNRPTGLREITAADIKAKELARAWQRDGNNVVSLQVVKNKFPQIARALRLNGTQYRLLQVLLGHSNYRDWDQKKAILVWPSNRTLRQALSSGDLLTNTTLKRAFRKLRQLSVVHFKDSVNRNRFGVRTKNGQVDQQKTFGIDLAPLAMQVPALLAKYQEQEEHNRQRYLTLKKITASRCKMIAWLEAAGKLEANFNGQKYEAKIAEINALKFKDLSNDQLDQVLMELKNTVGECAEKVKALMIRDAEQDGHREAKNSPTALPDQAVDKPQHFQQSDCEWAVKTPPPRGTKMSPHNKYKN